MEKVRLLKPGEVGATLQVSVWRVRQMCRNGELPFVRVGNLYRIPEDELGKWILDNHDSGSKN